MLLSSTGDALFMFHVGNRNPEHDEEEARQANTMPIESTAIPIPYGSLFFNCWALLKPVFEGQIAWSYDPAMAFSHVLKVPYSVQNSSAANTGTLYGVYQVNGISVIECYPVGHLFPVE